LDDDLSDWNPYSAALATSIFGVGERDTVLGNLEAWLSGLGLPSPKIVGLEMSVGAAIIAQLSDGSRIFAKAWPGHTDPDALNAQIFVQQELARRGFPAPRVRSALGRVGAAWAVLMEFNCLGDPTDVRIPGVMQAMADGLARLVGLAQDLKATPGLPARRLHDRWPPRPHSVLFDFEATAEGAGWIDDVGRNAVAVLQAGRQPPVLGHLDWSAKNMRMRGASIAVVYDWDSIELACEPFIVGVAAASFPTSWELPVDPIPTPEQSDAFVSAYERARGAAFDRAQRALVDASIRYSHAYRARCDHAADPPGARGRWQKILQARAGSRR
jgi:hypothetical protein